MNRDALVWYLVSFALLVAAGGMIGIAAVTFLASLTPLFIAIGLAVGAIVCSMVGLARQVGDRG